VMPARVIDQFEMLPNVALQSRDDRQLPCPPVPVAWQGIENDLRRSALAPLTSNTTSNTSLQQLHGMSSRLLLYTVAYAVLLLHRAATAQLTQGLPHLLFHRQVSGATKAKLSEQSWSL
jgi:hypothetical protein